MFYENQKEINVSHKTGNFGIRVYRTTSVQCHWHDEYEFVIPDTKPCNCIVNSCNFTVYPGQVMLISPGELHAISENGEAFTAVVFHPYSVSGEEFKEFVYPHVEYNRLYDIKKSECREIIDTIGEILSAFESRQFGYELMLKSLISKTVSLILKNGLYSHAKQTEYKQNIFFDVLGYIDKNISEKLTLDIVANKVNVSRSYISRLFRIYAGTTFCNYVLEARLDKAKKQLTLSDKNVLEIAMDCGFDNDSYFIKCFKKKWGITPYSYRKSFKFEG